MVPAASTPNPKQKPNRFTTNRSNQPQSMKSRTLFSAAVLAITNSALTAGVVVTPGPAAPPATTGGYGFDSARRPITNPTLFDLAVPTTNIHPIFMYHRLPNTVTTTLGQVPMGGDVQVYALQFEYAFTERLSLVATKDGYVDFNPDNVFADESGFANIAAGVKYAFLLDPASGTAVSGTCTIEVPTGNRDVFQGQGDGAANLIVSGLKLYDAWQFAGGAGVHIPFSSDMSTNSFVSAHVSYEVMPWFIPLVEVNWFRTLSAGNGTTAFGSQPPVSAIAAFEGHDLLNFGAANAGLNRDLITAAIGFRSRLTNSVDVGFAYEAPLSDSNDSIWKDRFTFDLVWKF